MACLPAAKGKGSGSGTIREPCSLKKGLPLLSLLHYPVKKPLETLPAQALSKDDKRGVVRHGVIPPRAAKPARARPILVPGIPGRPKS